MKKYFIFLMFCFMQSTSYAFFDCERYYPAFSKSECVELLSIYSNYNSFNTATQAIALDRIKELKLKMMTVTDFIALRLEELNNTELSQIPLEYQVLFSDKYHDFHAFPEELQRELIADSLGRGNKVTDNLRAFKGQHLLNYRSSEHKLKK